MANAANGGVIAIERAANDAENAREKSRAAMEKFEAIFAQRKRSFSQRVSTTFIFANLIGSYFAKRWTKLSNFASARCSFTEEVTRFADKL